MEPEIERKSFVPPALSIFIMVEPSSVALPVIVSTPLPRVMFELLEPEPPEPGVTGVGVGLGVPVIGGGVTGAPPEIFSRKRH